jgi:hypothetical protein
MKVKLETDGGFTGRGIGFVEIEGTRVRASDGFRVSEGTLLEDEERSLGGSLAGVAWDAPLADAHPDQITYTLTSEGRSVSWRGEDVGIRGVLWAIRDRVLNA